jgi:hypothetical protein
MLNGMLYLLVKGMMLPLRTLNELNNAVANLSEKSMSFFRSVLIAPAKLAGIDIKMSNSLKSEKSKTSKIKERPKLKLLDNKKKEAQKSRERPRQKLLDNVAKKDVPKMYSIDKKQLEATIFNKVQNNLSNKVKEDVITKLQDVQQTIINKQTEVQINSYETKNENSNSKSGPNAMSSLLLDATLNSFGMMARDFREKFKGQNNNNNNNNNNNIQNKEGESLSSRFKDDAEKEKEQYSRWVSENGNELNNLGFNQDKFNDLHKIDKDNNGGINSVEGFTKNIQEATPDWNEKSEEERMEIALSIGTSRSLVGQTDDLEKFNHYLIENPQAKESDYYAFRLEDSKYDEKHERKEFEERYNISPQQLLEEGMKDSGFRTTHTLNTAEFKEVVFSIAEKFPENERYSLIKDLRECNLAYRERERDEQKLQQALQKESIENRINRNGNEKRNAMSR